MITRSLLLLSSIFGSRSFCLASRLQLPKLPCLDRAVCARRVQVRVSALVQRRSHGRWAGGRLAPLGPAGLSRQGVCSLFSGCLSRSFCLASRLQLPKLPCLDRAVCARRVQVRVSALVQRRSHGRWAGGRLAPLGPAGLSRQGVPLRLQANAAATAAAVATASHEQSCRYRCRRRRRRRNCKPAQLPPPPPPPQLQTSTAASQHSCRRRRRRRRRNCKPA